MVLQFWMRRRWEAPILSDDKKIKLAAHVEARGPRAVTMEIRPYDLKMLWWSIGIAIIGGVVGAAGDSMGRGTGSKIVAALGAVAFVWGIFQALAAAYATLRDFELCYRWLSELEKLYGRNRAKYGN